MSVKSFLPIHIAEYMSSLVGSSKSKIRAHRIVLRSLFSTAHDNGLIDREITRKLPTVTGTYTGHRALERWEINMITKNYHQHRCGLGIMIMLWAGLRKGEAAALRWEDIDLEKGIIHVSRSLDYQHDTMKETKTEAGVRDVPIFAKLKEALLLEKKESGLVFTNVNGEQHTEPSIRRALEGFCFCMERIINGFPNVENPSGFRIDTYKKKFEKENREWKSYKFTAHDLRTTFATMCYDAGVDLHTVKRWMGHSNIETTLAIYTKLTEERRTESTQVMDAYSAKLDEAV